MKVTDPVSGVYGEAWSTVKCKGEAYDGGLLSIPTSCKGDNCSACRGVGVRRICAHNACQEYGCSLDSCFEIIPGPLFEVIK